MKKKVILIGFLSGLAWFQPVQAQKGTKHATTDSDAFGQDPKQTLIEGKLIEAGKYLILEDFSAAVNTYKDVLKLDPQNDAAHFQLGKIEFFQLKNTEEAMPHLQAAYKIDPNNKWYAQLLAHLYEQQNDFKSAVKILTAACAHDPEDNDMYYKLAYYQSKTGKYSAAIESLNHIEARDGISAGLSDQKEKLWLLMNKPNEAAQEIQRLIQAFPNETSYTRDLAEFYLHHDQAAKGMQLIRQLVQSGDADPMISLVLADYYHQKNEEDSVFICLKTAFQNSQMDASDAAGILIHLTEENSGISTARTLELATLAVNSHPDDARLLAMLADLEKDQNQWPAAELHYRQSLKQDPGKFALWQQYLLTEATLNHYDSLLTSSAQAIELFPAQATPYYFNGLANMQKKNFSGAVSSYSNALQIGIDNKKLKAQVYSQMGDAYNDLHQFASSDSCFELALTYNPGDLNTLNNYAYYLSERKEKLDRAEEMAKSCTDMAPDNSNYLDTYAWVLYKAGKLSEARAVQDKALQNGGNNNADVLEHYGDILFRLGQAEEALTYWKKAQLLNPGSKTLEQKISDKKLND